MIFASAEDRTQVEELMENLRSFFDIVRLVDPVHCHVLARTERGFAQVDACYEVWNRADRCRNCTSYRAALSGTVQEKKERRGDQDFHVISLPVSYTEEGTEKRFVLEMVRRESPEKKPEEVSAPEARRYRMRNGEAPRIAEGKDPLVADLLARAPDGLRYGVIVMEEGFTPIYANAAAFRLLRVAPDLKALGDVLEGWLEITYQNRVGSTWNQFFVAEERELLYEIHSLQLYTGSGRGRILCIHDVTSLARNVTGEDYRRTHDPLTGLYNREGFRQAAKSLIADNPHTPFTLLRMDVKDFKLVNQLFGIERGNEILMKAAGFIRNLARPGDVYGRLYGDQFVILTRSEGFEREKLRGFARAFAREVDGGIWQARVRFGIYEVSDRSERIESMFDKASIALRSSTEEGDAVVVSYEESMLEDVLFESKILGSFDEALETGQIRIYLQPQCDGKGRIRSAEALVRWEMPGRGIVPPSSFVSVLERAGLIYRLDRFIWNQAGKLLCSWKGTPLKDLRVSVNISPKDLPQIDVEEYFEELAGLYGIERGKLGIELTEGAIIQNPLRCAQMVNALQDQGFPVELDDFGSGYSSLNLLKDIGAGGLKLDMAFLSGGAEPGRTKTILRHMIRMARDLGMNVIVEGVETGEQVEMLENLGCERFQGYYFSEPVPVHVFEEMAKERGTA